MLPLEPRPLTHAIQPSVFGEAERLGPRVPHSHLRLRQPPPRLQWQKFFFPAVAKELEQPEPPQAIKEEVEVLSGDAPPPLPPPLFGNATHRRAERYRPAQPRTEPLLEQVRHGALAWVSLATRIRLRMNQHGENF